MSLKNKTTFTNIFVFSLLILSIIYIPDIACGLEKLSSPKQNIIFILADDLGWSDTTLYGHTSLYQTPNLQKLASRGMLFTHAYSASPLCSPTRSAVLTGLSPARTGITAPNCHVPEVILQANVSKKDPPGNKATSLSSVTRLKTEYKTLAESLKDAGYKTAHFGKWHLGAAPYSPLQHGFQFDLPKHEGPGPAGSYIAPWKFKNFTHDPQIPDEHIEDRMAKEAVKWMEQQQQPFYLNYWMFSVHAPFDAKKSLMEKYQKLVHADELQKCPTYAAMVESMDDAIGTLVDAVDCLKLTQNTIFIFTSDNGGNMYNEVNGVTPTSNSPLKGGKATMYEGGTRVPCVVVAPGITKPGSTNHTIIQSEDYYPTILELLELKPDPDQKFDGQSIVPMLHGETDLTRCKFQYFPHNPPVPEWIPSSVSVHLGDWKLIRIFHGGENGKHRYKLFNLKDDLSEETNLADSNPDMVTKLDSLIEKFLQDTHAVVPVMNPAFDPAKYDPTQEGLQKPKVKPKGKS